MTIMAVLSSEVAEALHFTKCLSTNNFEDLNHADCIHCFVVKLGALEASDAKDSVTDDKVYYCQMMLYDSSHQKFIGNIWSSKRFALKSRKGFLNQAIYFYTSLNLDSLLLTLEVVEASKLGENDQTIAWSAFSLHDGDTNTSGPESSIQYRISLFCGSPIALLLMTDSPEKLMQAKYPAVFELSFSTSTHPLLMRFLHLIPENYLVGSSDPVVGLYSSKRELTLGQDPLKKGQLQKCCTVKLGSVAIKYTPSLSTFESEVVKRLLEEREASDSEQHEVELIIVQRHLQVGVHNGLCYTQESDSYRLIVEPIVSQGSVTHCSSGSSTNSYARDEQLVVRSDIKIPNVPDDSRTLLVFNVEYTFSSKDKSEHSNNSTTGLTMCPSSSVCVLWGACLLSSVKSGGVISVPLCSDPMYFPNKILLLQVPSFDVTLVCSVLTPGKDHIMLSSSVKHQPDDVLGYSDSLEAISVPSHLHQLSKSEKHLQHRRKSKSYSNLNASSSTHLVKSRHQPDSVYRAYRENEQMEEVNVMPSSIPFVPPPSLSSIQQHIMPLTSRLSEYVRMLSAKLQNVYDTQGNAAVSIDPSEVYAVIEEKESSMEGNRIIFQIFGLCGTSSDMPKSLSFKFKFYRFPTVSTERVFAQTIDNEEDVSASHLHILHTNNSNHEDCFGCQVTFHVDPSDLTLGEHKPFIRYLSNGNMIIDVFDAESLLYFGTVIIPLKYLCRQGRDAVTATLALDVKHLEFLDDTPGPVLPLIPISKAQLFVRMSCIRVPLTANALSKLKNSEESLVATSGVEDSYHKSPVILKPSPILETNRELSNLMATRSLNSSQADAPIFSEERKRKLARMEAVRRSMGGAPSTSTKEKDIQTYFKERNRDLAVIGSYIEKNKANMIQNLLHSSLTQKKMLHPVLGEKLFFVFVLSNPYDSNQHIHISSDNEELSLVTETSENKKLCKLYGIENQPNVPFVIPSKDKKNSIFVRAKETVRVPFKYSTFDIDSEKTVIASSGHHFTSDILSSLNGSFKKDIKVHFKTEKDKLLSVLCCNVQHVPPSGITHVFRFLCPEHCMFQKTIVISNVMHKPFILCTDSNVSLDILEGSGNNTERPFTMSLKAPGGSVGRTRTFFLFIYDDPHMMKPVQAWSVHIVVVQRVDLSCTAGQTTCSSLIMRGDHSSRMVCCFADSPELTLDPSQPFVLSSCSIQELSLSTRCLLPGVGFFRVNLVDQNSKEILHSWLLVINCQKPLITKAFQMKTACYKEAVKRITISNSTATQKRFFALCSHPHILHLKDSSFTVGSKASYSLGLYFLPQSSVLTETIFLYLCDDSGSSQETYCVKFSCA